uniref:DAGKc domain-containing protein n=1 Tax=Strongyloides papillosus TaxID=174720 RepID=A0A0N5BCR7_STREA
MLKKIFCCCDHTTINDNLTTGINVPRDCENNVLIFLNPNSGSGKSLNNFHSKLLPALKKSNINFELIKTEGKNHCLEIAKNKKNLHNYKAVIIMSGDGLVFEWVNGVCQRNDKNEILNKLPIGVVPTGSGNGLLSSIFYANNLSLSKKSFQKQAVEIISSPKAVSSYVNLMHVETEHNHYTAFLSIGWGLLANIDIDSERWRKTLGSNRFFFESLIKIVKIPSYKGRLWYARRSSKANYQSSNDVKKPVYLKEDNSENVDSQTDYEDEIHQKINDLKDYHINKNIPPIHEELPGSWNLIDDEFIFIYAVTISHISRDGFFMPLAKLDDPNIYLTYCLHKDLPSRKALVNFLMDIEHGKHHNHPFVNTVKVDSFRFESQSNDCPIVVDGEKISDNFIQATSTELKMSIISNQGDA